MTRQKKAALQKRLIHQTNVKLFSINCKTIGSAKRAVLFFSSLSLTPINYLPTTDLESRSEVEL